MKGLPKSLQPQTTLPYKYQQKRNDQMRNERKRGMRCNNITVDSVQGPRSRRSFSDNQPIRQRTHGLNSPPGSLSRGGPDPSIETIHPDRLNRRTPKRTNPVEVVGGSPSVFDRWLLARSLHCVLFHHCLVFSGQYMSCLLMTSQMGFVPREREDS